MRSSTIFKTAFIFAISTLFFACTGDLEDKIAQMELDKIAANDSIQGKEELLVEFMNSMNEIEDNLAQIKEKENVITTRFGQGDGQVDNNMKDQIIDDIQLINNLLQENKDKMANLNAKVRKSNVKIAELETMIQGLEKRLQDKDIEIADLQTQLAEANQQLKVLFEEYNSRLEEIGDQEDKLNTAYYCYGSSKELLANGIITKSGGFIGIGKTEKLSKDFNKDYFTQVDISLTNEIDLMTKKAKIITNHPSDSYELEGEDGSIDKLIIKDAEAFWSASKYLVIVVE